MDLWNTTAGFFVTQGILGTAVVVLALVIRYLWLQIQAEREFSKALQQARYTDLKEFVDTLKDPLNEISTQQKSLRDLFTDFIEKRRG